MRGRRYRALCLAITLGLSLLLGEAMALKPAKSTYLPMSMLISDEEGIHIPQTGEYFIQDLEMWPGDVIRKQLNIQNGEKDSTFQLYLSSIPMTTTGPIDLLDSIWLEMTLGTKIIYSGRLYGDAGVDMVKNALDLGEYNHGDSQSLSIVLTLDSSLSPSKFAQVSEATIAWRFIAIKKKEDTSLPPFYPLIPSTGDNTPITTIFMLLSASIIVLELALIYRKKKNSRL